MRRVAVGAFVAITLTAAVASPAAAQLGPIDLLARRVSDLSFFYSLGGAGSDPAFSVDHGMSSFGVELLFIVDEVTRPLPAPEGAERGEPRDTLERRLVEVQVVRSEEGVDTVYRYEVAPATRPPPPEEVVWTLELGLGYGQIQGFQLADPALDLKGALRTLPTLNLYLSYEPLGNYFGLRTGFVRTQDVQVLTPDNRTFKAEGESFIMGALTGYAFDLEALFLFIEAGYTQRDFPSLEWSSTGPLPPELPRELDFSGWSGTVGIQFSFR